MKGILKDKILLTILSISFVFLIAGLILILVNSNNLTESLIIHIDAFQGVDMMGDINDVWNLFLMGIVIFIINSLLSCVFYLRERVISYIILSFNLVVSLFVLIKIANIISLN